MKIFIAKLNFSTTSSDLEEMFSPFGKVKTAKVVTDAETGKSKGLGFVEMEDYSEGLKAIEELNDTKVNGRQIVVQQAEPKGVLQNQRFSSYKR